MKRIEEKWYGGTVGFYPGLRYLGYAAAVVVALILALMVWTLVLNRLVNRRTAALRESESRLRALLDHIPDLVWLKDTSSTYITANTPFTRRRNAPRKLWPGERMLIYARNGSPANRGGRPNGHADGAGQSCGAEAQ